MRIIIAAALVLGVCSPLALARKWTDSTGKYTVEAEFIECKDGNVRLKKTDGRIISFALEKLSDVDQEHVRREVNGGKSQRTPRKPGEDGQTGNDIRTEITVSSQCDVMFKVRGVRQLGKRVVVSDQLSLNSQNVETKKKGFMLYALEFESKISTRNAKASTGEPDEWHTTFDPAWLRVVWADLSRPNDTCEILGWRQDGKGLILSTSWGTSSSVDLTGEIIFAGSTKGKELWINFLNTPTITIEH